MKSTIILKIVLSNVSIDIEKSGIVLDGFKECSLCQKAGRVIKKIHGLYIEDREKVEDDIFCTKMLPGTVVFSERFKEIAKHLTNLTFTEAEKYVPRWVI